MQIRRGFLVAGAALCTMLAGASTARAQNQAPESRWVVDVGFGIAPSINGNVNAGVIGTLQGQTTAILPHSYGDVYGTGIDVRFGGGYALDDKSEVHGAFIYQSADADLVRMGDIGPSSLYGQYSDYKSLGFDIGYRRYLSISGRSVRAFGEATIGAAFIDRINIQFAAPQSNVSFTNNDFYDSTGSFTWSLGVGAVFRVAEQMDLTAQLGLRHVGGLAEVDQLVGTGLAEINNDSSRLTFPMVIGVRFRFK